MREPIPALPPCNLSFPEILMGAWVGMSNRPCTCDDCDPEKSARVKILRSQKILKPVPCESYKQSTFIIAAHSLFCCKVCAPSCLQRFPDTSSSSCTILHRQFLCVKNKITWWFSFSFVKEFAGCLSTFTQSTVTPQDSIASFKHRVSKSVRFFAPSTVKMGWVKRS